MEHSDSASAFVEADDDALRVALEAAGVGVWDWDISADVVHRSAPLSSILGLVPSSNEGNLRTFMELIHPGDRAGVAAAIERTLLHGEPYDIQFRVNSPAGQPRWIGGCGRVFHDAGGKPRRMVGIGQDITARKQAEAELRASRDQLSAVFQSVSDGITVQNSTGQLLYANEAAARLTGYPTAQALVDAPNAEFMQRFELFDEAGNPYPPELLPGRRVLRGEQVGEITLGFRDRRTGGERWSIIRSTPVFDERGRGELVVSVFREVTAQRQADRERDRLYAAEQAAREAAQAALAERDAFIAGVTHDLKSPLTTILGATQLLQRRSASGDEHSDRLRQSLLMIESAATTMAAMVSDLVDLSRLQSGHELELDLDAVDLVALVHACVAAAQQAASQRVVQVNAVEGELIGQWDGARLRRVIANVLSNALKFSPADRPIAITVRRIDADGQAWAEIAVTDQGIGIPESALPHIFDRFYRAENAIGRVSGTGIGLANVRQIAEQHRGTVSVASVEGHGTTVTLRLPLA